MRLTDEQRAVVDEPGHVCLVSCPGSGKTRVIVAKLLYCIESVRDTTRRIACITHTNAAADEVDTRLRETCFGGEDLYYEVATIHGFALQNILRPFHHLLPELWNGFTILTPDADVYAEKAKEFIRNYGLKAFAFEEFERIQRAPDGNPSEVATLPADLQREWCGWLDENAYVTLNEIRVPGSEDEDKEVRILQPEETWQIVSRLQDPEKTLVVLIAATGVRISEALALQWRHVRFKENSIRIEQAFRLSEITTTKTKSSKANVPMCPALAGFLRTWRSQSPYHRDSDYVFASDKLSGKKPRTGQMINQRYLKPAAIDAGIITPDERFGFHLLRHSLSTWVHSVTKDLKVAQTMLRHSKPDITAGTYIHGVPEENLKAQGKYMLALMQKESSSLTDRNSLMNAKPVSDSVQ